MKSVLQLLLLGFAISVHHILAQNPPGFISLDCGLESNGYYDSVLGLPYTTDEGLIETGVSKRISPELRTKDLQQQFWDVRSFPEGSRNCYTLKASKGKAVLLRAGFMYGNYDDEGVLPEFDLHLGVNYWDTVTFKDSSTVVYVEILHIPKSEYLHVCVVNTGHGTPFISVLELRPIDLPYNYTNSVSLQLVERWDLGPPSRYQVLRYKDGDAYDRIWTPGNLRNMTRLNKPATSSFSRNPMAVPDGVLETANEAETANGSLIYDYYPKNSSDQVFCYLHFAEIVPGQSRAINIFFDNGNSNLSLVLQYHTARTVSSTNGPLNIRPGYIIEIKRALNSSLPPIINAAEIYTVKKFTHYETNDTHVAAIRSIKAIYGITRNWQGDPCWPKDFGWTGVNCSYNGFQPPNLISLNLSSSGLVGTIAPSISNLTMLQSLDLSYNNLTGEVPDFLSGLPALKYLYLQGNDFNNSLPPALLEKSRNGSLNIWFGSSINPDSHKSKKNTIIVPITASFAAFIVLVVVGLSVIIVWRKRHAVQMEEPAVKSNTNSNNGGGSVIEPRLRQCTFAEVMNMIRDKKVVGEGGFGVVYRGIMDGVEVAVKILKISLEQETRDLHSEVKVLAKVHHRNLIKILGYCNEGTNRAIIFELLENGCLNNYLSESSPKVLSWELRLYIMIDAAQGLEYLHHGCTPPIIHRDIKPENILLTKDFEAKLADFGLSRIYPAHTTREVGTPGYYDNEYSEVGMLTEKIDVYSFGVVLLVAVTGQPAIAEGKHITQRIAPKIRNGDIRGIVDPRLRGNYDINVAWKMVELGMACVSRTTSSRPNMHDVVRELNECLPIDDGDLRGPSLITTLSSRPSTRQTM